jgi:Protein of unknown function (DUF1588)/Protein of unknown function (DUF1592)/Protein of unknown function (DUF1595)/Protein of unknown function (DUF1585)/Protein of unknown function (DUF1587)
MILLWFAACTGNVQGPAQPGSGSLGGPDARPGADGLSGQEPAPLVCDDLGTVGAPVPMRRLTRLQVERTVEAVLGVRDTLSVTDERLHTFASNVSTAIDQSGVRAYYDFAQRVADKVDLKRCTDDSKCLAWLLDEVGFSLFRRPLEGDQRARYQALYKLGAPDGARWVLAAMLESPSFLYLDEAEGDAGYLDAFAVAARLALVLWGQNPDRALLDRAQRGELSTSADVAREAERLLQDARSEGGLHDFVDQWLDLGRLDDEDARPDLSALGRPVVDALRLEPVRFVQMLLAKQGDLGALLTSSETVRLDALTATYGKDIRAMTADGVTLDDTRRAGILTLPGVMAAHAHAGVTSPTRRGYTLLASLLCAPPPPPPANVNASLPAVSPNASAREKLEAHFSDDSCGSCHRSMDGAGFAFESFDWLGRTRTGADSETKFKLLGDEIEVDGPVALMSRLVAYDEVASCVAKQWARYASGVEENADGACLVRGMARDVRARDGLKQMMLTYLGADWFRRPRGDL